MMALCPNPMPSFLHLRPRHRDRRRPFLVRALDAAQPFDFESQALERLNSKSKLKIAVVGFGNFGQFLARTFAAQGHTLLAHSRSDQSAAATAIGASFFRDPHDLCEQHPDVVLLSTSILSAADVLNTLPLGRLRRSTLFADVLSVKEFPRNLLLSSLPSDFDILCTHPMFGPESARHGWAGLPFVFEKVRIGESEERISRCNRFLEIFEKEGCRMVEMSCAEHDHKTAESQFLTHTIGRILARLNPEDVDIGTKGYETLLELVQNTCNDSFDLYNGLFMYNKNATELLERLDFAFTELKKELFGNLHDILRKQLFESPQESNDNQKGREAFLACYSVRFYDLESRLHESLPGGARFLVTVETRYLDPQSAQYKADKATKEVDMFGDKLLLYLFQQRTSRCYSNSMGYHW